jgi:hypothetical protein
MSINREERRALKKKIAPLARQIVALEKQAIKDPTSKAFVETRIAELMEPLSLMEMMALQDYIESKGLLKNF